jgi:general secretion pathway protein A
MSAALIAPAGAGKTALLRTLRSRLPEARYHVRYVKVTSLSKRDLCREIAATLGLEPAGTYHRLVRLLQEHLDSVSSVDGRRPVLLLDEGHDMRPEVLAILRILTNFDMDSRLVLAVVLAGQPSLARLLERGDLAAIRSRLAHVATLRLLSRAETAQYVEHRLTIAGAKTDLFDERALDAVYEIARGNLRGIDHLCRKALELAALQQATVADTNLVLQARKHLIF